MTGAALIRPVADDVRSTTEIGRFLGWLQERRGLRLDDYAALHRWSVADLAGFWSAIWEFFEVRGDRPQGTVLARREMPGAVWFPGATLNYAEHALRPGGADPAIVAYSQTRDPVELTWADLRDRVGAGRPAAAGRRAG